MDRQKAIYAAELIELLLRADAGIWAEARKEFQSMHGAFGLKQLFEAEKALRKEWSIPDSKGEIDIQE